MTSIPDSSTWICLGSASGCPSALWVPSCCWFSWLSASSSHPTCSIHRHQPEEAGIWISVMFVVPLVSCSFSPRGISPEGPAHSCSAFSDAQRQCRKKAAEEATASSCQPALPTPLGAGCQLLHGRVIIPFKKKIAFN